MDTENKTERWIQRISSFYESKHASTPFSWASTKYQGEKEDSRQSHREGKRQRQRAYDIYGI